MFKQITAAIMMSTVACAPAFAQELSTMTPNSTLFYMSIPLDGKTRQESVPNFGFAMRGAKDYQVINFNDRMVNNMIAHLEGSGFGIETAWLVVGGIAAAAAVAVGGSGSSSAQQQTQTQQQTAAAQQQAQAATQAQNTPAPGTPCSCWTSRF